MLVKDDLMRTLLWASVLFNGVGPLALAFAAWLLGSRPQPAATPVG